MPCLPSARHLFAAVSFGVLASSAAAAPTPPGNVTAARVAADTSGDNWLVKGGSFAQQQFSPLRAINDKNVAELGVAWIAEMDDPWVWRPSPWSLTASSMSVRRDRSCGGQCG